MQFSTVVGILLGILLLTLFILLLYVRASGSRRMLNYDLFMPLTTTSMSSTAQPPISRRFTADVNFNWLPHSRVGFLESFSITYLTLDRQPKEISINDKDAVSVSIKHHKEERLSPDNYENPFTDIAFAMEQKGSNIHAVKFAVKKSGTYIIGVRIHGSHITGSPFFQKFVPAQILPEKSLLLRTYPPPVFPVSDEHKMTIEVRDSYENLCRARDVVPELFQFTAEHIDFRDHGRALNEKSYEVCVIPSANGNMTLGIRVFDCGIFMGRLEYDGRLLQNGFFEFIVLGNLEMEKVDAFTRQYPLGPFIFEADLEEDNAASAKKSRRQISAPTPSSTGPHLMNPGRKTKVKVALSSKNVSVSKKFWRFFNKRVMCAKVTLHTKITVTSVDLLNDLATFEVSDGVSGRIGLTLPSSTLRVAFGILAHFLRRKLGDAGSFSEKLTFFFDGFRKSHESLHFNSMSIELSIDRGDLLLSAYREAQSFSKRDWFRIPNVNFRHEPGLDGGGIRREFFELLCIELFETSGLFSSLGNSRLVHPNPHAKRTPKWNGKMYGRIWEFAGKIVGKCIFESSMGGQFKLHVKAKFTRSFLAQLLGLTPNYKYFEQDDPALYLRKIKYILENDVTNFHLKFTDEEYMGDGQVKDIDLIPNGSNILVTEENKAEYLNALAVYRLKTRVQKEVDQFCRGLFSIIPEDSLAIFDENELELLICGKSSYTLTEFQKFHRVTFENFDQRYLYAHARIMDWFWTVVASMTDDEKGRLLQFITGSSLLPAGGLRRLVPLVEIKPLDEFGRFPVAHTCSNQLCLPDQPDFETFEKRLLLAITEGCLGFEII